MAKALLPPYASVLDMSHKAAHFMAIKNIYTEPFSSVYSISTDPDGDVHVECVGANGLDTYLVDSTDVRPSAIRGTNYASKIARDTTATLGWRRDKNNINEIVCTLMKRFPRERREVVVLDHYDLRTSTLVASRLGLEPECIHVPNPNKNMCELHAESTVATVTSTSLIRWIAQQDTEEQDTVSSFDVLADYCCTLEGSDQCSPTVDLNLMFRKTLLAKRNGVLWITFSCRGQSPVEVRDRFHAWVRSTATNFDYVVNLAFERVYGAGMLTMIYVTGRGFVEADFGLPARLTSSPNAKSTRKTSTRKRAVAPAPPKPSSAKRIRSSCKTASTKKDKDSLQYYEIDRIVSHRIGRCRGQSVIFYRVKFVNGGVRDCTAEFITKAAVVEYRQQHPA